jgi:ABC-type transport system substrate-binding protein
METSTRVLALMRGEIDAGDSYLPTDQVERVERNARTRVQKDETMLVFIIRMNNQKPPFDNLDARLCFAHAFNYEGFNEVILKGMVIRNPGRGAHARGDGLRLPAAPGFEPRAGPVARAQGAARPALADQHGSAAA